MTARRESEIAIRIRFASSVPEVWLLLTYANRKSDIKPNPNEGSATLQEPVAPLSLLSLSDLYLLVYLCVPFLAYILLAFPFSSVLMHGIW